MTWTSGTIKEPDNLWGCGLLYFFSKHHQMSPKFTGRGGQKNFLNSSQTFSNWCVLFTSMRGSERMCLGTVIIFLNKLHMCLQMKNTLIYASQSKAVDFVLHAHKWKAPARSFACCAR